jgi:2-amino-4-hydroxy-6-hydroxymethyldihydropteridine diphosphokinase
MQPAKNTYKYILAFGSNIGDKYKNLSNSLILIKKYISITKQTIWHETKPLKHSEYFTEDHENYLNFACEAECAYEPDELYNVIVEIEDSIGHPRERRWMPRSLDVDILFCVKAESKPFSECKPFPFTKAPNFFVPHKEYFKRDFWRDMVENELNIPKEFLAKHFIYD